MTPLKLGIIVLLGLCTIALLVYIILTIYCSAHWREKHRWNSYYRKGYHEEKMQDKESGFEIVEQLLPENAKSPSNKIFSVSLYGTHDKYFQGTMALVDQCAKVCPEWTVRVYLHDQVSPDWRKQLLAAGCEVTIVADDLVEPGNSSGAFWRFMPLSEPNTTFFALDVDEPLAATFVKHLNAWEDKSQDYPFARLCYGTKKTVSNVVWPEECFVAGKFGRYGGDPTTVIDADTIQKYPHRSTFGSDEVFLYDILAPVAFRHGLYTGYLSNTNQSFSGLKLWPKALKHSGKWTLPPKGERRVHNSVLK